MQLNGKTYPLKADGNGTITYVAPDGQIYILDPTTAGDTWIFEREQGTGKPVIGFRKGTSDRDAELLLSLDGASSLAATLLHDEDDHPRHYIFATDQGKNNALKRPAFILRQPGAKKSPLEKWAAFRILVIQ